MVYEIYKVDIFIILCIGVAFRSIVSLGTYSGAGKPPLFGDYEAQRHWQEITYNLDMEEWYKNSSKNDLQYWGIDYPPLTAYHSFLMGAIAGVINSSFIELGTSRGYESEIHKSYMRLTVLFLDIMLYLPACLLLSYSLQETLKAKSCLSLLVTLVIYPVQIIIDNGHFQYNNVSLGLTAMSLSLILRESNKWAALLFTLALNYKQMELYHALPIFTYLLRACTFENIVYRKFSKLFAIGSIVLSTFALVWLPWLRSWKSLSSVTKRLFPVKRGIFEDKVANIWCSLNVVYKFKEKLSNLKMALVSAAVTTITILPLNVHLFCRYEKKTFLYCLSNTALSFYLLSFQVHEKSILLVAVPVMCLFPLIPLEVLCFFQISMFSVFPLLIKDELIISYFCMIISSYIIFRNFFHNEVFGCHHYGIKVIVDFVELMILVLSSTALFAPIPLKYPHMWILLISLTSCCVFIIFFTFMILYQFL